MTEAKKIKLLRRSQSISPFGVGSIIDQQGESFVPADITWWRDVKDKRDIIHEPRLEKALGVHAFRLAPAAPERPWEANEGTPGIPCVRFPTWMFCPKCRQMVRVLSKEEVPICESCLTHPELIPMRFVMACPRGHLGDIPWDRWAHSRVKEVKCESRQLEFLTHPGGSGLEFLEIHCKTCGSRRSLKGIASFNSLVDITPCLGLQPWQTLGSGDSCDAFPQVLQRGATNLTFAITESAIDIPPYSSYDAYSDINTLVASSPLFTMIRTAYDSGNPPLVEMSIPLLAKQLGKPFEEVRTAVWQELGGDKPPQDSDDSSLSRSDQILFEEYGAMLDRSASYGPKDRFIKRIVDLSSWPDSVVDPQFTEGINLLKDRLGDLVQVTRLREVRALRGFSRLSPPEGAVDDDEEQPGKFPIRGGKKISPVLVPPDLGKLQGNNRWLPAIEVYGEGIFLTLDEDRLYEWENYPEIKKRAAILELRREQNAKYLPETSPRLILLHTLAHLLIRQVSFECGYSIASLRERIYARPSYLDHPMAGIMIYTAAGDSEGTLGGLVRQGRPDLMLPLFLKALQNSEWCSSDPLCRESPGQGMNALNLAACHSCSLLPETSCSLSNRLLDRVMVLGNSDRSIRGFFTPLMDYILSSLRSDFEA